MAANITSVKGPIEVSDKSPERVALDLLRYLSSVGDDQIDAQLELFSRCMLHVNNPGMSVEDAKKRARQDFL